MCNSVFTLAVYNPFVAAGMRSLELWQPFGGEAEKAALCWDPWQLRRIWFAGLSEMMDSYMRSPLFLLWLGSYLKAITQPLHFFPSSH